MKLAVLTVLFAIFASAQSFMTVPSQKRAPTTLAIMTQEETAEIMKHANDCAHGECALDEVAELVAALQSHQKELSNRVEEVKKITIALEKVSSGGGKTDEIRETVRALFRVFQLGDKASGNDYPALSKPTGFSGEVGDGPQTAYDVLPPKKWTPSE
mmetsp:Transcript_29562/g.71133  ORF Transcript_29562/g.71133 Transcript_29562/m.71133 type:complete len:157 (-) Transcript_29562:139-609(-)